MSVPAPPPPQAPSAPKHGPFAGLDENALSGLAPHGFARSIRKNVIVVHENDETDSLYVVLAGQVKVFVSGEDGKEVVIGCVGAGDYFGELVLDGGARSASVITVEPCRFFVIPRQDIDRLLETSPAFARDLIRKLIGKVRALTSRVTDLTLKDVYGRFVKFVDEHAVEQCGRRAIPERLTQQEIAARIGGSREMVSRIVKDLTQGSYIQIDAKRIVVLKKLPSHW